MTRPWPRVVHLASGREWRGGQRQVLLLARALASRPIDQLVVTTAGSRLATELCQGGIPVAARGWHRSVSVRALADAVRAARGQATVFHAHDPHALTLAGIAARLTGSPFVVTRRVDFHLRRRGFWVRANRVIAISDAVRDILVSDGVPPDRVPVVHSGIDVAATRGVEAGAVRTELGLGSGPLAVSVAALVDHKDHRTLVRAAGLLRSAHPDLRWAVAGSGPLRDELEALARDVGATEVIHFLGQLADPLPLIRSADCFVMSSKEEGLGTSVLDAMALGVPVAATRAGGIPEMLDGGAGLLVPVGDAAALGAAVGRIVTEPALGEALRARAGERVTAFSSEAMADGVLQVYRSLALEC